MAEEDIKHFISNRFGAKGISESIVEQRATGAVLEKEKEFTESIDLRTIYPYSCTPFYHEDIVHYMDRESSDYFQMLLERNGEEYTEQIYDSVMKYASANMPNNPNDSNEDKLIPPIVIPAGYSQHRQEGRLNFGTDVEIEMPSGSLIMSRSVDISMSGIQLRVKRLLDVVDGMELLLSFPTLEERHESQFGQMTYVLRKHTIGSLHMSLFLTRKNPGSHEFDHFLESFIQAKKHRYRIDSEDSTMALVSKAWEYLYIKALPYLACFISTAKDKIQIQEIGISNTNQKQLSGLGHSMLSQLEKSLSAIRLNGIVENEHISSEIYAYRYRGDGIRRKLSACSWQFRDSKERIQFLQIGTKQEGFTAWRVNAYKLEDLPEARSRELLSHLSSESTEQTDNLVAQFNQYNYLLYLTDITDSIKRDPLLRVDDEMDTVPDHFFDDYELKRSLTADFTRLRLGIAKRRNEQRYIYRTPVILKLYGEKHNGTTEDFSINGLKVTTERFRDFHIRDTVYLEFTGFNKKFRSAKLKSEPYRVVAITPDGAVCLCRDHRVSQHKAAIFLKKLIHKNVDILTHCTGEIWMSTKARLSEAWMHQCLGTQSLLVARKKNQYSVPYIIESHTTMDILKPFAVGESLYDLSALLERVKITSLFRQLRVEQEHVINQEIYVSRKGYPVEHVEVKIWSDFETDLERAEYFRSKAKSASFSAYTLSYSAVPKLDMTSLSEEVNVVRKNSRHRLVEFEETYHSLVGILELIVITDQIRKRYNIS